MTLVKSVYDKPTQQLLTSNFEILKKFKIYCISHKYMYVHKISREILDLLY